MFIMSSLASHVNQLIQDKSGDNLDCAYSFHEESLLRLFHPLCNKLKLSSSSPLGYFLREYKHVFISQISSSF